MAAYENPAERDDWNTPSYIFGHLRVIFDTDVAAPVEGPRNVPCTNWYHENGLSRAWHGFVWMNPPFGHQSSKRAWLKKFFDHGNGIALLPDRTSAPWWQEYAPLADVLLFVSPKIKFERPDGTIGESPGTGTCLFAVGETGRNALLSATDLGLVVKPVDRVALSLI